MYIIERDFYFSAAHYLPNHEKCGKMHGHNYKITLRLRESHLDHQHISIDFSELKEKMQEVLKELDHKCLNDILKWTTAEFIAKYIYEKMRDRYVSKIHSVTVEETRDCRVTYRK